MSVMGWRGGFVCLCIAGALLPYAAAYGQDRAGGDEPLTKEEFSKFLEEYRQFKAEYSQLKTENESLRSEVEALKDRLPALTEHSGEVTRELAFMKERLALVAKLKETEPILPGLTNFTLGGFFSGGLDNREGSDSSFGANVAPILLWKPTEELLFETRFDIFLAEEETDVELAYAQLSYLLNDYITLGGGKFVLPFGIFWERARAPWINKLPTLPLVYESGFVGESGVGFQIRGGAPIGPTKINYAAYVINGPDFRTNPSNLGRLGFGRGLDNNNNKSVGGRIGFLPIPELEIGSSILIGRVGSGGTLNERADTVMVGVDASYGREFDAIKGRLDLRGEFIHIDTDDVDFGGLFDLFSFDNQRDGWYIQAAYRPTKIQGKIIGNWNVKDMEFVLRYDQIHEPGRGGLGVDHDQLTAGIDYWILPSVVLKFAYVFDNARGEEDQDGFFLQVSAGF